jgi:hypothetical protein
MNIPDWTRKMVLVLAGTFMLSAHTTKYPVSYFQSPVNREIKLSGTFGELRSNHFHAGLDIKSLRGRSGDTLYAAASGFVSRIQVNAWGYGNVLYIDHPNGFTTVYAHLDRFAPTLQQYVTQEQYRAQQFEVDLYPAPFQFPIGALQEIGIMGNTGHSYGPHLHFEVRHTDTQTPVNPLHFGLGVEDQLPPVIQQLIAYQYSASGQLLKSTVLQPKWLSSGVYTLSEPLTVNSTMVTFGVRTIDYQNGMDNQNGIYSLSCAADDEQAFAFAMDEISFQHTRYLNAHIDYKMKLQQDKYFHRCSPLEGNKLPIYFTSPDDGMIVLNGEQPRDVSIRVADFNNNISTINFEVKRDLGAWPVSPDIEPYQLMAMTDQVTILSQPGIQVVWPSGSFYEKTPINIATTVNEKPTSYSPHYTLSPKDIPVHYFFEVAIDGLGVPDSLQDKAYIARIDPDGSLTNCGGSWVGNNLTTGVRQMGAYAIKVDTVAPSISPVQFSPRMNGWRKMSFKIWDNLRVRDKGRGLIYNAYVDGKWILMSHDGKNATLTHEFDGSIAPGDHSLVIKVVDDRGNEALLVKTFTL